MTEILPIFQLYVVISFWLSKTFTLPIVSQNYIMKLLSCRVLYAILFTLLGRRGSHVISTLLQWLMSHWVLKDSGWLSLEWKWPSLSDYQNNLALSVRYPIFQSSHLIDILICMAYLHLLHPLGAWRANNRHLSVCPVPRSDPNRARLPVCSSGDPIAIAAALAAHEAKKRKKKILETDPEMLPTSLKSVIVPGCFSGPRLMVTVPCWWRVSVALNLP